MAHLFGKTKEEHELKTAGALEAAADPGTDVTAEDAERVMAEEARKAGGQGFNFDPDASAEEKAAAATAVRAHSDCLAAPLT